MTTETEGFLVEFQFNPNCIFVETNSKKHDDPQELHGILYWIELFGRRPFNSTHIYIYICVERNYLDFNSLIITSLKKRMNSKFSSYYNFFPKIKLSDISCVHEILNTKLFSFIRKRGKLFTVLKCNYFWSSVCQLFICTRRYTWRFGHLNLLNEVTLIFSIYYFTSLCINILRAKLRLQCIYQQED